jgi:hypothetical protein
VCLACLVQQQSLEQLARQPVDGQSEQEPVEVSESVQEQIRIRSMGVRLQQLQVTRG